MYGRSSSEDGFDKVENVADLVKRQFRLNLLGHFELLDHGSQARLSVSAKKSRALLAYLAAAPGCQANRSVLATLLWGDVSEEQARQSLRQALSGLRRTRMDGAALLKAGEEAIRLESDLLEIDCHYLLQLPDDADIDRLILACAAYRGPFGAGLEVEEAGYDDWLRSERQRFADRAIVVHDRLIRRLGEAGRHQEALTWANVLLAINPIREETHRAIIALEAQVSGRAAAMQRFENFRLLLRDELAVRPEAATIRLVDQLRDPPVADNAPAAPDIVTQQEDGGSAPIDRPSRRFGRRAVIGGGIALVAVIMVAVGMFRMPSHQRTDEDRRYGRALVALDASANEARQNNAIDIAALELEVSLAFSRNNKVTLIEFVDGAKRHPDYRVRQRFVSSGTNARAEVSLVSTDHGEVVWSGSIPVTNVLPTTFARELYGYISSEIVLREARDRSKDDSVPAKLWRARAAQIQTRLGTEDLMAQTLYEDVLAKDATNVVALLGLSDCLILRVARNQSSQRAADIAAIGALLIKVRPLIPNASDIAFKEGMLNKLQGNFQQASSSFEQSVRLDPAHWNAAAQYAHVMIFLGRLEEGYQLMQAATPNLLPDLGAAETAYIAGETALVAGHDDEAARYLGMAVTGNPTVGRIQALYAVALLRAARFDEARIAVEKARQLSPSYTPDVMNQRGGRTADPRYVAAKNAMVETFRQIRGTN